MVNFGRILTAMITPFTPEGKVDYPVAAELAKRLVENGSDGLVITGTTGNPYLDDRRKAQPLCYGCRGGGRQSFRHCWNRELFDGREY